MDELIDLERAGWRSLCDGTGSDFYGDVMIDAAYMVFADGSVLSRDDVIGSLRDAPRWSSFSIEEPRTIEIADGVVTLLYVGHGHRTPDDSEGDDSEGDDGGGDDFTGVMASTYVRRDDRWMLALYQQTGLVR